MSDDQQLRLVRELKAAAGRPLDFDELRAMGIEHPAVLCYELEIAGVPIVQAYDGERRLLALDTAADPAVAERAIVEPRDPFGAKEESASGRPLHLAPPLGDVLEGIGGRASGWWRGMRRAAIPRPVRRVERRGGAVQVREVLAALGPRPSATAARVRAAIEPLIRRASAAAAGSPGALLGASVAGALALAVLLAVLLSAPASVVYTGPRVHRPQRTTASHAPASRRTSSRSLGVTSPGISRAGAEGGQTGRAASAGASTLQLEGHQLLADGHYRAAIDRLTAALQATGESLPRCVEPSSETCLTFAYALYDLGRALRLDGQARAAIPVLSRRLRIDNQRAVVERELELARAGAA